jgi:hypothetical protein
VQVHVAPGALEDVRSAWREVLGDAFLVLDRDAAVDAGWYGPTVRDDVRSRLGDLLALAVRDHVVVDSRVLPEFVLAMVGMHGGLSPEELEVPLLVHRA